MFIPASPAGMLGLGAAIGIADVGMLRLLSALRCKTGPVPIMVLEK